MEGFNSKKVKFMKGSGKMGNSMEQVPFVKKVLPKRAFGKMEKEFTGLMDQRKVLQAKILKLLQPLTDNFYFM